MDRQLLDMNCWRKTVPVQKSRELTPKKGLCFAIRSRMNMRIAVLSGGISRERDVSLLSGAMVARALRASGNDVALVDSFLGVPILPDDPCSLFTRQNEEELPGIAEELPDIEELRRLTGTRKSDIGPGVLEVLRAADITYNALHGGDGENGRLQAFLDVEGIRYTGDGFLPSALAMQKDVAKLLFTQAGVPVPGGRVYTRGVTSRGWDGGWPVVVKPCSAGSSVGVLFADNPRSMGEAVMEAFRYDEKVLVEQRIIGREFAVGVLGGRALPVIEISPDGGGYDYAHKYQAGRTTETCPAQIPLAAASELQRLAELACGALGITVCARGEFIVGTDGVPRCLEMNTLPGMTPVSLLPQEAQAAGLSFEELCMYIVDLSLKKYE